MKRNEYTIKLKNGERPKLFYKNRYHHEMYMYDNKISVISSPAADIKWFNFFSLKLDYHFVKVTESPTILGDE